MSELEDKLIAARKVVDDAVYENFGYCPDYRWLDQAVSDMNLLEARLKQAEPDRYAAYQNKHY